MDYWGVKPPLKIRKSHGIWVSHHELFMGKYLNKMRSGVQLHPQNVIVSK